MLSACAKDQTQDEYNRQKQSEEYAKIQAIAGVYVGKMDSVDRTQKLDVALELKAGTRISTSAGTSGTVQAATVQGRITILNDQMASVSFDQGFFDTDTLELRAALEIVDRAGVKSTVELAGKIEGDTFSGSIENQSYAETKRGLSLSRNAGESERAAVARISQGVSGRSKTLTVTYSGVLKNHTLNDKEEDGSLVLIYPVATAEQLFLEEFSPVRVVEATLNTATGLASGTSLFFPSSKVDGRRGVLYGLRQQQTGAVLAGVYLSCTQLSNGWNCEYYANDIGLIYSGVLTKK